MDRVTSMVERGQARGSWSSELGVADQVRHSAHFDAQDTRTGFGPELLELPAELARLGTAEVLGGRRAR